MKSKFTTRPETHIDQDISRDLETICSAIDSANVEYDAIYLVGGFGRGEGTVRFDGVRWRGVNDYDLIIVAHDCIKTSPLLKHLSKELAKTVQIDFVDLGCIQRKDLSMLAPTMQNYDFKFGGKLLSGTEILSEIPDFKPGYLPPYELVRLVCNRSAGLLSTKLPERSNEKQYKSNQLIKACIAVGDVAVFLAYYYHHSYQTRFEMFQSLVNKKQLPFVIQPKAIDAVKSAYIQKLEGPENSCFDLSESTMKLMIFEAFLTLGKFCTGKTSKTISETEKALRKHFKTISPDFLQYTPYNLNALKRRRFRSLISYTDLRNRVLFSLPFFYYHNQANKQLCAYNYLSRFSLVPGALFRPWNEQSVFRLWEKFCH